jgi:hypothetical protein
MDPQVMLDDVSKRFKSASSLFSIDLNSMPEEMLRKAHGGKARTGLDVAFEVAAINDMAARAIEGLPAQGEMPKGWVRAPEGFDKAAATQAFDNSVARVNKALSSASPDIWSSTAQMPFGPIPMSGLLNLLAAHTMYHSGQLNFMQTLDGDEIWHWMEEH